MKEKLAIVIAALVITSMALSIPTTSVSAGVNASATLSPTAIRDDTRVKLTITVTNLTDYDIDNVLIKVVNTGQNFTQAIGGATTAEALENASGLIENAVAPLKRAGENLKLAADNAASAGQDLASAATSLDAAADYIAAFSPGWENNVAVNLIDAAIYLKKAGDNIALETENLILIDNLLSDAALKMRTAAGPAVEPWNMALYNQAAAENLDNAGALISEAATALHGGSLLRAGENIRLAGVYLYKAGTDLRTDSASAGAAMESAGTSLQLAGLNLKDAAQYDNLAGIDLVKVAENLVVAATNLNRADSDLGTAAGQIGYNIATALENDDVVSRIKAAGENLKLSNPNATENILATGLHLSQLADNLNAAATELGVALGGDELGDVVVHENHAADNLDNTGNMVNLKVTGEQLIAAGDDLSAAASTLLSTANAIAPTTWSLASDATNQIIFATIGENENWLRPDESLAFTFLWKAPDIAVENTYTLRIALYEVGDVPLSDPVVGYVDVTLTVDGQVPVLTVYVTQVGVYEDAKNLVGTALDDGRATIHIFSSEPLQSIGKVYIENSGGTEENLMPPIENTALTKVSDTYWTYEYITVENWDDNTVVVRVASAKDIAGRENTASMENTIIVDSRAPILENSGLAYLVAGLRENVNQAGSPGTLYRYVDNRSTRALSVIARDNVDNATGMNVVSVTVDWGTGSASAERDILIENLWSLSALPLSEGYNSIVTVTATDRVGFTISENIENIFQDTQVPTIEFNTITTAAGTIAFTSGVKINDNKPEIKVTVTDPGYPTSGLGVSRVHYLVVTISNKENFDIDQPGAWIENLENKVTWNPSTGIFENVLPDNAGKGLLSGTYYVRVIASDNLYHAGKENENSVYSFTIDVTPISTTDISIQGWTATIGTIDNPSILRTATRSIVVSIPTGEIGGTIKVYVNGEVKVTETMTTATKSINIPLATGVTNIIELTFTDVSANESGKLLYGYLMVDSTGPTVSITAPETDLTTDAASISLEATVTKDAWETYAELIVRIDATSLIAPIEAANALSTDGKLARAIGLVEGTNTITVSVQDTAGNWSTLDTVTVTRTVTPWATYAIIIVIVALVMSAIAIFRKR